MPPMVRTDRDLRPLAREMLEDNMTVLLLRHRAEMLVMAEGPKNDWHSVASVTNALHDRIAAGTIAWAPPCWRTSSPMPYSGGVGQHLQALRQSHELLENAHDVTSRGSRTMYRLTRKARQSLGQWREENAQLLVLLSTCETCGGDRSAVKYDRPCPECCRTQAPGLLPSPAADFEHIAALYERTTGCPVIFGVTDDLQRVIRVKTLRGVVEHRLHHEMSWHDAVDQWLGE